MLQLAGVKISPKKNHLAKNDPVVDLAVHIAAVLRNRKEVCNVLGGWHILTF